MHREIKDDLHLEAIRVFDYHSIKHMAALVWITAGFYYTRLAGMESMDIFLDMARSVPIVALPEKRGVGRRKP